MILAVGSAADDTFLYLLQKLRATPHPVVAVDVIQLAVTGSFVLVADSPADSIMRVAGQTIPLREASGVWIRLPHLVHPELPESRRNLLLGTHRAISATIHRLPARVVNPPLLDPSNFSKPAHLAYLAAEVGLDVPETCVTNDPQRARNFIAQYDGQVIYKGVSSAKTWVRRWDPVTDNSRLDLIRATPVQFQRLVRGPDVRVHVAAGSIHAERIDSASVDYRQRGSANRYRRIDCPPPVVQACRRLSDLFNAPLLGVDFKIDSDTERWVLLEVNVLPCFQGYDRRAAGRISAAIVGYLTGVIDPLVALPTCPETVSKNSRKPSTAEYLDE